MDCTGTHSARSAGRRVRATAVHVLCFVALGVSLYYLTWRALYTFNPHALWLSLLLYAAECYGVVVFIFHLVSTWDTRSLERSFGLRPSETMADAIMPPPPPSSVDVFVTTYDESVALLRKTVIAAREIRLEHETWVLDDGRRDEVRELCEELGVRYLSRGSNAHAKAGNINAAMSRTRGEFIVVLDADFIALPSLLERTLGYFTDQNLAFVQLPQAFYNIDSVQHVEHDLSAGWHEQSLFYDVIQPGKNRWNAAFWCGTPTVLRRSALETVGGVAISAVTEDVLTSLRLHAAGWRSAYHNETLAVGIAPGDLEAFCIQRLRWAQGSMQILRSRENPLIKPGLSLFQRASYLASMTAYFQALQLLVFALMPFLIVASGQTPLTDFARPFLERFVPYVVLVIVAIKATAGVAPAARLGSVFLVLTDVHVPTGAPDAAHGGSPAGFPRYPEGSRGIAFAASTLPAHRGRRHQPSRYRRARSAAPPGRVGSLGIRHRWLLGGCGCMYLLMCDRAALAARLPTPRLPRPRAATDVPERRSRRRDCSAQRGNQLRRSLARTRPAGRGGHSGRAAHPAWIRRDQRRRSGRNLDEAGRRTLPHRHRVRSAPARSRGAAPECSSRAGRRPHPPQTIGTGGCGPDQAGRPACVSRIG